MNKDLILTVVCCALFVLAFGRTNFSNSGIHADPPFIYFHSDSVINSVKDSLPDKNAHYYINDSTIAEIKFSMVPCRNAHIITHVSKLKPQIVVTEPVPIVVNHSEQPHKKTRGDIRYEYSMHDSPDTSYPGSGFNQNYVITNLYTTIAGKYPVIFHFGTLQTTVPYIPNNIDISLQFDQQQYSSNVADQIRHRYENKIKQTELEDSVSYRNVLNNFNNTQSIQNWLNGDKQVQDLMQSARVLHQSGSAGSGDSSIMKSIGKLSAIESSVTNPSIKNGLSSESLSSPDSSKYSSDQIKNAIRTIDRYKKKLDSLYQLKSYKDSLVNKYDSLNSSVKTGKDSLEKMISAEREVQCLQKIYYMMRRPVIRY